MDSHVVQQFPRYRCHKEVYAIKIAQIVPSLTGAFIHPQETTVAPFEADHNYLVKHKPEVGGYFVVYDDGYKSYSPAQAFEEGYTITSPIIRHETEADPEDPSKQRAVAVHSDGRRSYPNHKR